jgi:transposase
MKPRETISKRTEAILSLFTTGSYSTSEIADALGVSQPTVYNYLKRLGLQTNHLPKRYRAAFKFEFSGKERSLIRQLAAEGLYVSQIAVALSRTIGQ